MIVTSLALGNVVTGSHEAMALRYVEATRVVGQCSKLCDKENNWCTTNDTDCAYDGMASACDDAPASCSEAKTSSSNECNVKRDYQPKVECYGISSDEQGQRCGSTNDSEVCYEGYQCYCTDGDHEHASTGDCGCNTRDTGEDGTAAYKQGC